MTPSVILAHRLRRYWSLVLRMWLRSARRIVAPRKRPLLATAIRSIAKDGTASMRAAFPTAPPRKIKAFVDLDHPCPRCDSRNHYVPHHLKGDIWTCECIACRYEFTAPVVFRDELIASAPQVALRADWLRPDDMERR